MAMTETEFVRTVLQRGAAAEMARTDTKDTTPKLHARKLKHKHDVLPPLPGKRVKNQGGTVPIEHP